VKSDAKRCVGSDVTIRKGPPRRREEVRAQKNVQGAMAEDVQDIRERLVRSDTRLEGTVLELPDRRRVESSVS